MQLTEMISLITGFNKDNLMIGYIYYKVSTEVTAHIQRNPS